jgi:hypothetical protein
MTDYLPFGLFLAAPLAGAAFSVDAVFALALGAAAFFVAALGAPAAFSLLGAGFSVGAPAASSDSCSFEVALARDFAVAAGVCSASPVGLCVSGAGSVFGAGAALAAFAGFSA